MKRFISLCVIVLTFAGFTNAQTVEVEMDSTRQLIRGFGGIHIPAWTGTELNEDLTAKAFGNDPGEIGLTILRLRIDPDSNQFYRELSMARQAVDEGAIVFASPWNPPLYMLDPESVQRRLDEDYYDDYVVHLNQYNTYMNDSGVPLYAISVQNEPDYVEDWTGWTAAEMIKFLEENGGDIESRVIAPESFQFRRPYTDSILNDPEASANVDIVGGHIYGGGLEDYPLAREMGKEVWMTEHLTGSSSPEANTWELALALGVEISECMKANFNAYVWWYIRRFYSLITDDGNISKKGYVMSQFTKFVRPGAFRVDATPAGVSNINAYAYKTDSSLVIVVVNTNSTEINLDFTIDNNMGIDTLIKFTTSAAKNVVNDGGYSVAGDMFTASVDANSVTTFTSYADYGGKFENAAPVADAGGDIIVEDSDGNGLEIILLDGSASADSDGTIVNYSWSLSDVQVAWGDDSLELEIPIGEHIAVLTVTDSDGATDSDTINISIESIYSTEMWAEAECTVVGSTWEVLFDEGASNGVYIGAPLGTESVDAASTDTADHLIYTFHVEEAGPYKVWARVITPSPNDDSYWVRIDSGSWAMWNSIPSNNDWHWDDVHDGGPDNPVVYQLDTGHHELSICYREDGAYMDKLLIANTGIVPTGLGEEGLTCTITEPEEPEDAIFSVQKNSEIRVYPNPATHELHITSPDGFTCLRVISLDGSLIREHNFAQIITETSLEFNIEAGVYILMVGNKNTSAVTRFIVN